LLRNDKDEKHCEQDESVEDVHCKSEVLGMDCADVDCEHAISGMGGGIQSKYPKAIVTRMRRSMMAIPPSLKVKRNSGLESSLDVAAK
jgi:hypothetical protein